MGLPKVVFGAGTVLLFKRGPAGFSCYRKARVNDNLATSGLRERVVEAQDLILEFSMPALQISDDYLAWDTFMAAALGGVQFDFYPNVSINEHYHVVSDDDTFQPSRVGPGVYSASFKWRIVPDESAPAGGPAQVMRRFYGIAG